VIWRKADVASVNLNKAGWEFGKMLNHFRKPCGYRAAAYKLNGVHLLVASAMILFLVQSACLKKKSKVPITPSSSIRIAFLPFNVPENNKDLRWMALANPILMAKVSERAPDLVAVPFWESMPVAIESAGASRIFTEASAGSTATWLSAKWSAVGDISPAKKNRISLIIDFIPARGNEVPFRYMKARRMEYLGEGFPLAFTQFLRYLSMRPLEQAKDGNLNLISMKPLAEALDREYGWFGEADPGKAQEIVADLAHRDRRLAELLFNPSVYPVLKQTK
jgi:hypothetical protein